MSRRDTFEYEVLRRLNEVEWENAASVRPRQFGETTRNSLIEKGWIETRLSPIGIPQVRLTKKGVAAFLSFIAERK